MDENNTTSYGYKQPVETLSRSNWRNFFEEMELWLISKGWFYTCKYSLLDWCEQATFDELSTDFIKLKVSGLTSTGASTPAESDAEGDKEKPKAKGEIRINYEKQKTFIQDSASALFNIRRCIDTFDKDLINECQDNRSKWSALKAKYSKTKPKDVRDLKSEIVNWKLKDGLSVEDSWVQLKEKRRRLAEADQASKISQSELFGYFLNGLPEEFDLTKDTIDAQPSLDVDQKLDILQRQYEKQTERDLSALAARAQKSRGRRYSPPSHRHSSSSSESDNWKSSRSDNSLPQLCYTCGGMNHITRDCKYRQDAKKYAQKLRIADERKSRSDSREFSSHGRHQFRPTRSSVRDPPSSSRSQSKSVHFESSRSRSRSRPDSKSDSQSRTKSKSKSRSLRDKAYTAEEENSDVSESEVSTGSEDEINAIIETAAVSREQSSKISSPKSKWIPDSAASSHMTDQPQLFRSPLKEISRRIIKVGGGKLYTRHMGTARMTVPGGSTVFLKNCLFVPRLGANLMSTRKICSDTGLQGAFNDKKMYLHKDNQVILSASFEKGVYVVDYIKPESREAAFSTVELPDGTEEIDLTTGQNIPVDSTLMSEHRRNPDPIEQERLRSITLNQSRDQRKAKGRDQPRAQPYVETNTVADITSSIDDNESALPLEGDDGSPLYTRQQQVEKRRIERYNLWHRRLGHVGPSVLRKIHTMTTLKRPINIPPQIELCDVCAKTKMRKRTSKVLAEHKDRKLALLSIDIAGPFPTSIRGFRYFAEVIDNWSRKVWTLLLKRKDDIIPALDQLALQVERQTGEKIIATRTDNAGELIKVLSSWKVKDGVKHQLTATYTSSQNGPAERAIQTSETDARAMLKDADLPVEFWCYTIEADTYVRNRRSDGPEIIEEVDGVKIVKRLSPEAAWTGQPQSIDHLRAFGCKAFSHVDPKSHPAGTRKDKFMDRGRECVFVGYNDDTTKQHLVYAPDLQRVVASSYTKFKESVPGGSINLNLNIKLSGGEFISGQGTPNTLAVRNPRGRPTKAVVEARESSQPEGVKPISHTPPLLPKLGSENRGPKSGVPEPRQTTSAETTTNVKEKFTQLPDIEDQLKRQKIEVQIPSVKIDTPAKTTRMRETSAGGIKKPLTRHSPRFLNHMEKIFDKYGLRNLISRPVTRAMMLRSPTLQSSQTTTEPSIQHTVPNPSTVLGASRSNETKRKRDLDNGDDIEGMPEKKILRAMIALIDEIDEYFNEEEVAFFVQALDSNTTMNEIPIPRSYREAIKHPVYGEMWKEAIEEELRALLENKTWEEVFPPSGVNLVDTKWVFTVKPNLDGTLERFKARLVARGFSQQFGVDYRETFAPTVQMATFRTFLALVAAEDLECRVFDIKNAFTESEIKEDIYLKAPQGVHVKKGNVLKVLRSLYGLKQSARDWNLLLRSELCQWGFLQSKADPCLYVHKEREIMVLTYVDDIPAAARDTADLDWFKSKLAGRFNAKDLGEITKTKILGMRVTRDRKKRTLWLDQESYLDRTLKKFGIGNAKHKPVSIPLDGYTNLRPATDNDTRVDPTEYSEKIGSFMFSMVYTRPDLAFPLGRLSQYMRDPAEHHNQALKKLMRYIRSTVNLRLRFGPGGDQSLVVYSDADYASDKKDRKSVTGAAGILGGAAIFWMSRKQNAVSTSTTEAEYTAMSITAKQGQWIAQLLRDMGYPQYIAKNGITVETRGTTKEH